MIYDTLRLYIDDDFYFIEPTYVDPSRPQQNIYIDRDTAAIKVNSASTPRTEHLEKIETVYGLLGIIKLHAGDYLVAISERQRVGLLGRHSLFQVAAAKLYPFHRNSLHMREEQIKDEEIFLSLLDSVLHSGANYFSYTFDITNSLQRQVGQDKRVPMWKRADDRFFWNRYLMRRFIDMASRPENDLSSFILPVLHGFVAIRPAVVHHRPFVYALISRRSRYRVGTRYFSRGVDKEGNVSNFVETEQIVLADPPDSDTGTESSVEGKLKMSYVQTRGSIPVFWAQVTNLKYAPKLYAVETPQTVPALRRHIDSQLHIYGPQTLVNLVNKKGYEKAVGDLFTRVMTEHYPPERKADHNVTYVHWDFHTECSKMRWDRISLLLEVLDDNLKSQGYYYEIGGGGGQAPVVRSRQNGTARTNCMDCLDRTNVVQSMIARHVLAKQLSEIGVFSPGERVEDDAGLYHVFRNVWADNADAVSSAYSGTGALKTDFTRTGRRTRAGALRDGVNSVVRYLKNNYFDGARQDAFDLFLGNFEVSTLPHGAGSPFRLKRTMRYKVLPALCLMSAVMIILGLNYSTTSEVTTTSFANRLPLLWISFWNVVLVLSAWTVWRYGIEFADRPRLVQLVYGHEMPGAVDEKAGAPGYAGLKEA